MIILKRYSDLEKMLSNLELDITTKLSRPHINEFTILFDKKMSILEKELNKLYDCLKDFEITGKHYDSGGFTFTTNTEWTTRITRSVNAEVRFINRKNELKNILIAGYSTKKNESFLHFPKDFFIHSTLDCYSSKHLEELLIVAEKMTNKIFDREITGLISGKSYEINYLCRYLYQNLEKPKNYKDFMENKFKVKDVEEYIELEILKNDFKKPVLPKSIQRLKK